MEFVILYLAIMFGVIIISVYLKTVIYKPLDPNALLHTEITTLLTDMDEPESDGVCYGFTLNWAQAVAQGDEELFYQKIDAMRKHRKDLVVVLKGLEHKNFISAEERATESLPDLFKKISIAQDPENYRESYGALIKQPDIGTILAKINSKKEPARHVFYKTHSFSNKNEAIQYFNILRKLNLKENVAVVISTANHAMGFKIKGNEWLFIDINNLYQQDKDRPYYQVPAKQLVDILYDCCFDGEIGTRLTVNTDFISTKDELYLTDGLRNVFPVFPFNSKISYKEKIDFFRLAAIQGDMVAVKKCLRAGLSFFSSKQLDDNSPIARAIYQGRRDVFKAMIHSAPYRLNQKRKSDGASLLHLACLFGGSGIVEELLGFNRVVVDAQDAAGRTPLMQACRLSIYTNEEKLIQLLLDRGASLTKKDKSGLTALDHAIETGHHLAQDLIVKHQESLANTASKSQVQRVSNVRGNFFGTTAQKKHQEDAIEYRRTY